MKIMITIVIVHYVIRRSHIGYENIIWTIFSCAIYFICINSYMAFDLHSICKIKIKVYKSEFLEKHKIMEI